MRINLRRCFFHSIVPLYKKDTLFNYENGQIERCKLMLKSGYIYPGNMLEDVIPSEYDSFYDKSSDSVFLAQHVMSELPSYGGSFFNGEFSAYLEHIAGNPSWVFSEKIVDGKRIFNRAHSLSEEVCIQESIDLREAIALMLPYRTLALEIERFLQYKEYLIDEDYLDAEMKEMLKNKDKDLENVYGKVSRWKKVLEEYGYEIPCINDFGDEFNIDNDRSYISKNEERIRMLLKK